jgi:Holliday junction resolvase RusA-like endonuclease
LDTAAYSTEARRLAFEGISDPVAMPRPRVAVRGGKAHGYIPSHASQAMWEIRQAAIAALGDVEPLSGALSVTVTAYLRPPASIPKRDRLTALPVRRPDVDNFAKCLLDGCSPLWGDDSQVVDLHAAKRYSLDSPPRWEVVVEQLR